MIRRATEQDIARIVESRAGVSENALSDPPKVTLEDIRWLIVNPGIFVWEDESGICGFSAADTRNGSIWALFVDEWHCNRGIVRALLERLHNSETGRLRQHLADDGSSNESGAPLPPRRVALDRQPRRRIAL